MKKLWPVVSAVACLVISGCSGSSAPDEEAAPLAPIATPAAPAAAPTPIPVAAAPDMPSAPKPRKSRSQSRAESSASSSSQTSSGQTPSQIASSISSQIRATDGESNLLRLELEIKQKMYQYQELAGNINLSMDDIRLATKMEAMMEKLAAACEGKRIGNSYWTDYISAAQYIAGAAETEIRNANNPAAQQQQQQDWTNRINAEKARNGGRRY